MSNIMKAFLKRASSDATFAKAVLERPQTLFEELNLPAPPEGVELKAVQNDSTTFHVVMPPSPNTNVTDEVLAGVAGGDINDIRASSFGSAISCASSVRLCH